MDGSQLHWTETNISEPVWISDDLNAWITGTIQELHPGSRAIVLLENKNLLEILLDKNGRTRKRKLLPRDILTLDNGVQNMDDLTHLHEASILDNVIKRFRARHIYTKTGPILVAMNPFEWLPLYGPEMIKKYRMSSGILDQLEPHCFAQAEIAYHTLCNTNQNQSMIICGESGAGKTETTKLILEYLSSNYTQQQDKSMASRIVLSNPLMEAFGNAKTLRNNNSSRFGKFIRLDFDHGNLYGGYVHSYLLEKSRTVKQKPGERNYHIFYQLCNDPEQTKSLHLASYPRGFYYLSNNLNDKMLGVDDTQAFSQTLQALDAIGMSRMDRDALLQTVAAVLHLGNIDFENSQQQEQALQITGQFLQIDPQALLRALQMKTITVGGNSIESPLDTKGSQDLRDATAKFIYQHVFSHVIHEINRSFGNHTTSKHFIGILDIYGFESFDINGFEQLLINFANESLQYLFNEQIFQSEEKVYQYENIPFKRTDMPDNTMCLTLLTGIFDLMHDECLKMNAGSNHGLVNQMNNQFSTNDHFVVSTRGKRVLDKNQFAIAHYAGDIVYTCEEFLEKDKDTIFGHVVDLLKTSRSDLVRKLFQNAQVASKLQHTVAKTFSNQVVTLTKMIRETGPSFIRCIKSNNELEAFHVDARLILDQLRTAGVVAALDMRRAGYPNRLLYREFCLRGRALFSKNISWNDKETDFKRLSMEIFTNYLSDYKDQMHFGKTKIFLRANVIHALDGVVQKMTKKHLILIQCCVRQYIAQKALQLKRKCASWVQRYYRGWRARRLLGNTVAQLRQARAWAKYEVKVRALESGVAELETLIASTARLSKSTDLQQFRRVRTQVEEIMRHVSRREHMDQVHLASSTLEDELQDIRAVIQNAVQLQAKYDTEWKALQKELMMFQKLRSNAETLEGFQPGFMQVVYAIDDLLSRCSAIGDEDPKRGLQLIEEARQRLIKGHDMFAKGNADLERFRMTEQTVREELRRVVQQFEVLSVPPYLHRLQDVYAYIASVDQHIQTYKTTKYTQAETMQLDLANLADEVHQIQELFKSATKQMDRYHATRALLDKERDRCQRLIDDTFEQCAGMLSSEDDFVKLVDDHQGAKENILGLFKMTHDHNLSSCKSVEAETDRLDAIIHSLPGMCATFVERINNTAKDISVRRAEYHNILEALDHVRENYIGMKQNAIIHGLNHIPDIQKYCVQLANDFTTFGELDDVHLMRAKLSAIVETVAIFEKSIHDEMYRKRQCDNLVEHARSELTTTMRHLGILRAREEDVDLQFMERTRKPLIKEYRSAMLSLEQICENGFRKILEYEYHIASDHNPEQFERIATTAKLGYEHAETLLQALFVSEHEEKNILEEHALVYRKMMDQYTKLMRLPRAQNFLQEQMEECRISLLRFEYALNKIGDVANDAKIRQEEDSFYLSKCFQSFYDVGPQRDTMDVLLFASANPMQLLESVKQEACMAIENTERMMTIQNAFITERASMKESARQMQVRCAQERIETDELVMTSSEQLMQPVWSLLSVVGYVKRVWYSGETIPSDAPLMVHLRNTYERAKRVQCLMDIQDTSEIEQAVNHAVECYDKLQGILFDQAPQWKLISSASSLAQQERFFEALSAFDTDVSERVYKLKISKSSFIDTIHLYRMRFRTIKDDVTEYWFRGGEEARVLGMLDMKTLIDDAESALIYAEERVGPYANIPAIVFSIVECLDDVLVNENGKLLQDAITEIESILTIVLRKIAKCESTFARCCKYATKESPNTTRRFRVLKYSCVSNDDELDQKLFKE